MEAFVIVALILGYVLAKLFFDNRANVRQTHARLLEEALKNPALDRATIETLSYQLTGHRPLRHTGPSRFLATVLAIGWVALFSGLGVWAIGAITGTDDATAGGVLTAIIGFGLVTYPFALRELESRRQAQ